MSKFLRLSAGIALTLVASLSFIPGVVAQDGTPSTASSPVSIDDLELSGIKTYLVEHVDAVVAGNAILLSAAQQYYDLASGMNFDYQEVWDQHGDDVVSDIETARDVWINQSSGNYELSEGIVAGVPSLVYYDLLLDAGPSGEEDPANALDNEVTLPDGTVLKSPGSFYHHLTEPALWGTDSEHVGLAVDFDGDGRADVAVGVPMETYSAARDGVVHILRGTQGGMTSSGSSGKKPTVATRSSAGCSRRVCARSRR